MCRSWRRFMILDRGWRTLPIGIDAGSSVCVWLLASVVGVWGHTDLNNCDIISPSDSIPSIHTSMKYLESLSITQKYFGKQVHAPFIGKRQYKYFLHQFTLLNFFKERNYETCCKMWTIDTCYTLKTLDSKGYRLTIIWLKDRKATMGFIFQNNTICSIQFKQFVSFFLS